MKKIIYKYIVVLLSVVTLWSCDDFLDTESKEQVDDKNVYNSETNADLALAYIYASLPDYESETGRGVGSDFYIYNYDRFDNWSDDALGESGFVSWAATRDRAYTPDSYGVGTNAPIYSHRYPCVPFMYEFHYRIIRACNKFLEGIEENRSNFSESWYTRRKGEALFLRAYYYHWLLMAYGGVPVITSPLVLSEMGENVFVPRSTYEQTVQFIIDELDAVLDEDLLPNERGAGRATRGAALALKGWVEMFAHRYEDAADTYKEIIDDGVYEIFTTPQPGEASDPQLGSYTYQFFEANNNNSESIFAVQHQSGIINSSRIMWSGPRYAQLTYSLAQDYRMSDGLPREESPLWNDNVSNPEFRFFQNRESRFYQSVIYYSAKWRDGVNWDQASNTRTGMFTCKGIDQTIPLTSVRTNGANTPLFRYAEVLLLYAEAMIEAGTINQSVYDAIDEVRVRGKLPTLENTYGTPELEWKLTDQDEMRKIVRRERRVEFAFESKRYWDLIRWGTAPDPTNYYTAMTELNKPKQGSSYDEHGVQSVITVHESMFHEYSYLFPIPRIVVDQNPTMKAQNGDEWTNGQNPGYN